MTITTKKIRQLSMKYSREKNYGHVSLLFHTIVLLVLLDDVALSFKGIVH